MTGLFPEHPDTYARARDEAAALAANVSELAPFVRLGAELAESGGIPIHPAVPLPLDQYASLIWFTGRALRRALAAMSASSALLAQAIDPAEYEAVRARALTMLEHAGNARFAQLLSALGVEAMRDGPSTDG